MIDVTVSEWIKLRSLRSTYWFAVFTLLALVGGCLIAALMTADWDASAAAEQAKFEGADAGMLAMPIVQFLLAALCGLLITSEFGTGMIRSTLVAVPLRRRVLAAKLIVGGGVALVAGMLVAFTAFLVSQGIVGDRPAPIAPWASTGEGVRDALADGLVVFVAGLVALSLGAVIRSTAGVLVSMTAMLFVLPTTVYFLPSPHGERVAAVLLPNLGSQIAGTARGAVFSPGAALAVLVAYVVLSVGAAAYALGRRDA